jgi:hypothetical protein
MKEKFSETPKSPIPTRFEIVTLDYQKEEIVLPAAEKLRII